MKDIVNLAGKRIQGNVEELRLDTSRVPKPRESITAIIRLTLKDTLEQAAFFEETYEMNNFIIEEIKVEESFEISNRLKEQNITTAFYVEGRTSFKTLKPTIVNNKVIDEETDRFIEGKFAIRLLAAD